MALKEHCAECLFPGATCTSIPHISNEQKIPKSLNRMLVYSVGSFGDLYIVLFYIHFVHKLSFFVDCCYGSSSGEFFAASSS